MTIAARGNSGAMDDAMLVAAAKSGDDEAFELLVERYGRIVLFTVLRFTANREDAEDVVQQSFQKAFVHLKKFQGRSSFSTWLTRIAINEALMSRRNGRRWHEVSLDEPKITGKTNLVPEIADSNTDPEHSYFQQERQRILFCAMHELRPGMRVALQLRELHERSVGETARILGVSASAVKSRVIRGRRVLRNKLMMYLGQ